MAHEFIEEAKEKMDRTIQAFSQELTGIRTGRASTGLLDNIEVDVYGQKMKLNQVGTISAPEARLLTVTPWDKSQIKAIEKAILTSPLELTPSNDGSTIRIPLPELNEERRRELVKLVSKLAEEAKVSIRNTRRAEIEKVKTLQKDGDIPEDDAHRLTDEIQKLTDEYTAKIDKSLESKEAEIMEV